jgi:hypothetical protein
MNRHQRRKQNATYLVKRPQHVRPGTHVIETEAHICPISGIPPEERHLFPLLDLVTKCRNCERDWTHSPQHSIIMLKLIGMSNGTGSVVCEECAGRPDTLERCASSMAEALQFEQVSMEEFKQLSVEDKLDAVVLGPMPKDQLQ